MNIITLLYSFSSVTLECVWFSGHYFKRRKNSTDYKFRNGPVYPQTTCWVKAKLNCLSVLLSLSLSLSYHVTLHPPITWSCQWKKMHLSLTPVPITWFALMTFACQSCMSCCLFQITAGVTSCSALSNSSIYYHIT